MLTYVQFSLAEIYILANFLKCDWSTALINPAAPLESENFRGCQVENILAKHAHERVSAALVDGSHFS